MVFLETNPITSTHDSILQDKKRRNGEEIANSFRLVALFLAAPSAKASSRRVARLGWPNSGSAEVCVESVGHEPRFTF